MSNETFAIVVSIAGSVIGLLLLVLGFFLRTVHSDVKENTEDKGKMKGKIEQLELQISQERQLREIEIKNQNNQMRQAIENMARSVGELSTDVKMLIKEKVDK